jgi:hypothetical protein
VGDSTAAYAGIGLGLDIMGLCVAARTPSLLTETGASTTDRIWLLERLSNMMRPLNIAAISANAGGKNEARAPNSSTDDEDNGRRRI